MRMSQALNIIDSEGKRTIACSKCDHLIGPTDENWKPHAVLYEQPISSLGETYTTNEQVLLRSFVCPGCGVLLETEVALAGDPFLEDLIFD